MATARRREVTESTRERMRRRDADGFATAAVQQPR